jgi:type III pantothenate kinase
VGTRGEPVLAIDAGNTRIKWGVHDGRGWAMTGAVATADSASLAAGWHGASLARRAIASNVAGPEVAAHLARACADRGIAFEVIRSVAAQCGVTNAYADPAQLGTDRWAALVAARDIAADAVLVVMAGTALTIDALASGGRFMGGVIVPGPAMMRRSLDRGTAGLRLTEGRFTPLPRSTPDAITSGAIQAAAGAVERMAAAMRQSGVEPARLLLSGGAAAELEPHLHMPAAVHENLVLEGLVRIARDA